MTAQASEVAPEDTAATEGEDSTIYIYSGTPYVRSQINEKVRGYFPVEHKTLPKKPCLDWMAARFPLEMWRTVLAFFERTMAAEKSESQVRLFYRDATDTEPATWKAWAFPQESNTGMTTKELPDHPGFQDQMNVIVEAGFYQFGSIHHHCGTTAFQSATDKNDEENNPGIHITVGKIGTAEYDLHSRFTLSTPGQLSEDGSTVIKQATTNFYEINLSDFFEIPEGMIGEKFPDAMLESLLKYIMVKPSTDGVDKEMVDIWMKNRIKKVHTVITGGRSTGVSHHSGGVERYHYTPPVGSTVVHGPRVAGTDADFFRNGTTSGGRVVAGFSPTKHADIEKILEEAEKKIKASPGAEVPLIPGEGISLVQLDGRADAIMAGVNAFTAHVRLTRPDLLRIIVTDEDKRSKEEKSVMNLLSSNVMDAYHISELQLAKVILNEIQDCQRSVEEAQSGVRSQPKENWTLISK